MKSKNRFSTFSKFFGDREKKEKTSTIDGQVCKSAKKTFLTIFNAKFTKFSKKFFLKHFSCLLRNLFSDLNYNERFARYFKCTEPQNRFL